MVVKRAQWIEVKWQEEKDLMLELQEELVGMVEEGQEVLECR